MDLETLLTRFGNPDTEGDGWLATCPAHADTRPSLRLALGTGGGLLVKCRAGCGTADVLRAASLTWPDIAEVAGVTPEARRARSADAVPSVAEVAALAVKLDGYAAAYPGSVSARYASERFGVSDELAAALGLGCTGRRLVVPFRNTAGAAMGFQARDVTGASPVRWKGAPSPAGASWAPTGVFLAGTGWAEVVVTEGPGDALTAAAAGFDTVAVRGASLATRPDVAAAIADFAKDRPVVVFGDDDTSGRRFARTIVAALARLGVAAVAAEPGAGGDVTGWREAVPAGFREAFIKTVREAVHRMPGRVQARLDAFTEDDLTDLGMAQRLRAAIESDGSGVRFAPEAGFFILDDGVWRPDRIREIRTRAQDSVADMWAEVRSLEIELGGIDDPKAQKVAAKRLGELRKFARHANSTRGIDSMIRELEALRGVAVEFEAFDAHPHLLAVANGVIDLRTGTLGPHDPGLLLTKRVAIDYDPAAEAPRWLRFLAEVFPTEPEMPDYLRRLVGYGITGDVSEQCFAVHYGTGSNGKSLFVDSLTSVFRELTVTTPFSTFELRPSGGIPNDLAALKGARFAMAAEGEQGKPMAEAVLKRVTGKDMIAARFMRKEFFEFRPNFLLMLATNYKPNFRGQDEGLWRRVKLIEWARYFSPAERDPHLDGALMAEAQGILAWAVKGAAEWYAHGLGDPACVRSATLEYRETSNPLVDYYPGIFEPAEGGEVGGDTLWREYGDWAEAEALPLRERMTRRAFFSALEAQGLIKRKRNTGVVFQGVQRARVAGAAAPRLAHVPGDTH